LAGGTGAVRKQKLQTAALPIFLFFAAVLGLALLLLLVGRVFNPARPGRVKQMPYESGMDPIHDTRRRFDVRFHLLAIAFLVFDVELLFLYPWAVAVRDRAGAAAVQTHDAGSLPAAAGPPEGASSQPLVRPVFAGGIVFLVLLTLGFVYDWRKGVFRWR
jgi:NADH-quinone oxidoreductase subunit A